MKRDKELGQKKKNWKKTFHSHQRKNKKDSRKELERHEEWLGMCRAEVTSTCFNQKPVSDKQRTILGSTGGKALRWGVRGGLEKLKHVGKSPFSGEFRKKKMWGLKNVGVRNKKHCQAG